MMVKRARLKTRIVDGIEMMGDNVPIGHEYFVDVSNKQTMRWLNAEHGPQRSLVCVLDVMHGGWLPVEVLEIEP